MPFCPFYILQHFTVGKQFFWRIIIPPKFLFRKQLVDHVMAAPAYPYPTFGHLLLAKVFFEPLVLMVALWNEMMEG